MGNVRPLLKAIILLQMFYSAVCAEPPWSCYKETGSCYHINTVPTKHTDASCWCRSAGGQLLKIDSQEEMDLIIQLMTDANNPAEYGFYIGATDNRIENQFVWEDGTDASLYLPWHPSGPDNYGNYEHCVIMHNKLWWYSSPPTLSSYMTFDIPCQRLHYFICERVSLYSRQWRRVSRDEKYLTGSLGSFSHVSCMACAKLCITSCLCVSFGCRQGRNDGDCILYKVHYKRRNGSPLYSPGFVIYD